MFLITEADNFTLSSHMCYMLQLFSYHIYTLILLKIGSVLRVKMNRRFLRLVESDMEGIDWLSHVFSIVTVASSENKCCIITVNVLRASWCIELKVCGLYFFQR